MSKSPLVTQVQIEIQKAFKGHQVSVQKAVTCFLASGHLLIEDQPGVGKTLLAQALAKTLGLGFKRLQMTPDLMPSDVTGGLIWIPQPGRYEFRPGPLFSELVLLDELNRASSKTQSAVLQAMEEKQISVDGQNYELPPLFFLMATQNPKEDVGVNKLPSSQLDRFALKLSLGLPKLDFEKEILRGGRREDLLEQVQVVGSKAEWLQVRHQVGLVKVSDAFLDYVLRLATHLRGQEVHLSTRALQSLVDLARAWAYLQGRDFVIPEDASGLATEAWTHRLGRHSHLERPLDVQDTLRTVRVL
ncbi:MAG: AAA family ATPase [Bdellovibrio sp.]|jgi:MoxR-like ATPase